RFLRNSCSCWTIRSSRPSTAFLSWLRNGSAERARVTASETCKEFDIDFKTRVEKGYGRWRWSPRAGRPVWREHSVWSGRLARRSHRGRVLIRGLRAGCEFLRRRRTEFPVALRLRFGAGAPLRCKSGGAFQGFG